MKAALLLVLLLPGIYVQGQINSDSIHKKSMPYFFNVQSGALVGCSDCRIGKQISYSFSTLHGVKIKKRLRVGASTGLDSYFDWNVIPLYGIAIWDLFRGKENAFFLQFGYGHSLKVWRTFGYDEYGFKNVDPGKIYSFGAGYRIMNNKMSVSFGIGQKVQQITTYYEYPTYQWLSGKYVMGDPSRKKVLNELNRLTLWMSVGLN